MLLVRAESDATPADIEDEEELNDLSIEAADASHPAFLSLRPAAGAVASLPAIRHDEEHDWWIARIRAKVAGAGKTLDLELVVVGEAEE